MLKKILKLLPWSLGGSIVGLLFANFVIGTVEPQGTTAPGKAVSQGPTKGIPVTVTGEAVNAIGLVGSVSYKSQKEIIAEACDGYYQDAVAEDKEARSKTLRGDGAMQYATVIQAYTQLYMACRERAK